jgi:hypothetical protein
MITVYSPRNAYQVGANAQDDEPLWFGGTLRIVLRIAEGREVDSDLAVNLLLRPAGVNVMI